MKINSFFRYGNQFIFHKYYSSGKKDYFDVGEGKNESSFMNGRKKCLIPSTSFRDALGAKWSGRRGFNPRSPHTKDFKNRT